MGRAGGKKSKDGKDAKKDTAGSKKSGGKAGASAPGRGGKQSDGTQVATETGRKRVRAQASSSDSDHDQPLADRLNNPQERAGAPGSSSKDTGGACGRSRSAEKERVEPQREAQHEGARAGIGSDSDDDLGAIAGMYADMSWAGPPQALGNEEEDAPAHEPEVLPNAQSRHRMEQRMDAMNSEDDPKAFAMRFVWNRGSGSATEWDRLMQVFDAGSEGTDAEQKERQQACVQAHTFWADRSMFGGLPIRFGLWPRVLNTAVTYLGPSFLHDTDNTRFPDTLATGERIRRSKIATMFVQAAVDTELCGTQVTHLHAHAHQLARAVQVYCVSKSLKYM